MKNANLTFLLFTLLLGWQASFAMGQLGGFPGKPPAPPVKAGNENKIEEVLGWGGRPGNLPPVPLQEAIAELNDLLVSKDPREVLSGFAKLQSLGANGFAAVPAIIKKLDDDDVSVRHAAIEMLGRLGIRSEEANRKLVALTRSNDEYERVAAARTLGANATSESDTAKSVQVLRTGLQSSDDILVRESAHGLADVGTQGIASLEKGLNSRDANTRATSIEAMGRIDDPEVVKFLAKSLSDPDPRVRASAADSISKYGVLASPYTGKLAALLDDDSAEVRSSALLAMGEIGTPESVDSETRSKIIAATKSSNDSVTSAAFQAASQLEIQDNSLSKFTLDAIQNRTGKVKTNAIVALASQGPKSIPVMKQLLEDPATMLHGVMGLSSLDISQNNVDRLLVERLDGADPATQIEILLALANDTSSAQKYSARIASYLVSKTRGVQYAATYAIANSADNSKRTIDGLRRNARSSDPMLKMLSFWANAKLNPDSPTANELAYQQILSATRHDHPVIQQAAMTAMTDIGIEPQMVARDLPGFMELIVSTDQEHLRETIQQNMADLIVKANAFDALRPALGHPELCKLAMPIVEKMSGRALPLKTEILQLLQNRDANVKLAAIYSLAAIGEPVADNADKILKMLNDQNPDIQLGAAYALGRMDKSGMSEAALKKLMTGRDRILDQTAAISLAFVSREKQILAGKVVPFLVEGTLSRNEDHVVASIEALRQFDSLDRVATARLQQLSKSKSPRVREAAKAALERP